MTDFSVDAVKEYLLELQDKLCTGLEQEDGSAQFMQKLGTGCRGRRSVAGYQRWRAV